MMNDPSTAQRLARWLARAADVPLEDRTTQEARREDLARLREQLASSGRFGRWVLKVVETLEERSKTRR